MLTEINLRSCKNRILVKEKLLCNCQAPFSLVSDLKFNQLPKGFPTGRDVSHVDPYTKNDGGLDARPKFGKEPLTKMLPCGHC